MGRLTPALLGWFFTFATLICALTSVTLFVPHGALTVIWRIKPAEYAQLLAFGPLLAWGFAALAAVMALAAWGSFRRGLWGWRLGFSIIMVNALGDLTRLALGDWPGGTLGVLTAGLVLCWLARPAVRAQFADARSQPV